jgi:hypothetical protein
MHTIFSSESSSCDESTLATPYRKEIKTIAVNMGKRRAAKPKGKEPGTQKRQRVQTFLVSVMRCWVLQFDDGVCPFYSCSPSKLRARAHTHTHTQPLTPSPPLLPHPHPHPHPYTRTHIHTPYTHTHTPYTHNHRRWDRRTLVRVHARCADSSTLLASLRTRRCTLSITMSLRTASSSW